MKRRHLLSPPTRALATDPREDVFRSPGSRGEDAGETSDRVRYTMNGFVISCGTYVQALGEKSIATARKIGRVEVDMGDTACRIPDAESYILKCRRGAITAPKRKTVRC